MQSNSIDSAISVLAVLFNNGALGQGCYDVNDLVNGSEEYVLNAGAVAAVHLKALIAIQKSGGCREVLVQYWAVHINKNDQMVLKLIFDMYKKDNVN